MRGSPAFLLKQDQVPPEALDKATPRLSVIFRGQIRAHRNAGTASLGSNKQAGVISLSASRYHDKKYNSFSSSKRQKSEGSASSARSNRPRLPDWAMDSATATISNSEVISNAEPSMATAEELKNQAERRKSLIVENALVLQAKHVDENAAHQDDEESVHHKDVSHSSMKGGDDVGAADADVAELVSDDNHDGIDLVSPSTTPSAAASAVAHATDRQSSHSGMLQHADSDMSGKADGDSMITPSKRLFGDGDGGGDNDDGNDYESRDEILSNAGSPIQSFIDPLADESGEANLDTLIASFSMSSPKSAPTSNTA